MAASKIVGMGFGLMATVVIGRHLGAEGLGLYGYSVIILSLIAVPVSNGWSALTLRSVAAAVHDRKWASAKGLLQRGNQIASLLAVVFFALGSLTCIATPNVAQEFLNVHILGLMAVILWLNQLSALRLAVLRGLQHPIWGQVPELLVRPLLVVSFFLLITCLMNPPLRTEHAIWALFAASSVTALIGGIILKRKTPAELAYTEAQYDDRKWFSSSSILAGNAGLVMLNSQVDILVLGQLETFDQVGIYRVAMQAALVSGFAYTAFNMLAMQRFALLYAAGDFHRMVNIASFMARIALGGSLALLIFLYIFGEKIVLTLFGESFLPVLHPLFFLVLGQVVSAFVGMAHTLIIVIGKERTLVRLNIVALISNALLCYLCIPQFGIVGAAASSTLVFSLWNIATWFLAWRLTGVDTSIIGFYRKGSHT